MFDVGWQYGSFGAEAGRAVPAEPVGEDVAALLDAAEDIVNRAAPDILAEFSGKKPKRRFGKRAKRKKQVVAGPRSLSDRVRVECERRESNPHPRRDRVLNPARLPFRHARVGVSVARVRGSWRSFRARSSSSSASGAE